MALELAQIVAELVQAVLLGGEMEGGADGLMVLLGGPAAELQAALEENLQEANDARVVELDAGIAHPAEGDGQSEPLQERKVGMDIEPLRVGAGEAVGDGQELLADGRGNA